MEHETEHIPELLPTEAAEPNELHPAAELPDEAPVTAETADAPAANEPAPAPVARVTVCDVQFRKGSKIYFFDPGSFTLKAGDHVIIDTARGAEYGTCILGNHRVLAREIVQPLRSVVRLATAQDDRIREENERKEKAAFLFCQRKIEDLGLDMQLASCEAAFDGSKLLFYFTADERVDFRELVKILASNYHTRIELRQIGVRDKARMFGGLGICGRPFCCASFLGDFEPVSIKMAKTQNLSLNPTKISGTCGRLMCCLKYEQEAYEDLLKTCPKAESFVDTPEGRGTVTAVNLMRQSVNVRMEKDPEEIHTFQNSEILVLRSGKARKNDPEIPEDLAPISGKKETDPLARISRVEQRLVLDADEAEATAQAAAEPKPQPEAIRERRSGRGQEHRRDSRRSSAPEQEHRKEAAKPTHEPRQPAEAEKPEQTEMAGQAEGGAEPRQQRRGQGGKYRHDRRGGRGGQRSGQKPGGENPAARETPKPILEGAKPVRETKPNREKLPQERGGKPGRETVQDRAPGNENYKKNNNHRRYYHNRKPKQGS